MFDIARSQNQVLDDLAIAKNVRFKYRFMAMLLSFAIFMIPVVFAISLFVYRELIYLLGGIIVLCIVLFFTLSDRFFYTFINQDFHLECKFKESVSLNFLLYLFIGIVSYGIFYFIVRFL